MSADETVQRAEHKARAILEAQADARIAAVRSLALANQAERAAELALEEARRGVIAARAAAERAGWSERELREMELMPGARKRRTRRAAGGGGAEAVGGAHANDAGGAPDAQSGVDDSHADGPH